jgi:signal transduction histidine kinase
MTPIGKVADADSTLRALERVAAMGRATDEEGVTRQLADAIVSLAGARECVVSRRPQGQGGAFGERADRWRVYRMTVGREMWDVAIGWTTRNPFDPSSERIIGELLRHAEVALARLPEGARPSVRDALVGQLTIEDLTDIVFIADATGRVNANRVARRWLGAGEDTPVDPWALELIDAMGGACGRERRPLFRALERGEVVTDEPLAASWRGVVSHWAVSAVPVREGDGPRTAIEVFRPARVERGAARGADERTAIIAHELRQAVGAMMLLHDMGGPADRMGAAARRIARLVDDLDRDEDTRRDPTVMPRPTEVDAFVRRVVEELRPLVAPCPIELHVEPDLPRAAIDEDRVAQVLSNLITNAARHGAAGRPILVKVLEQRRGVQVAVANEGRAIPEEVLDAVFRANQRAPLVLSSAQHGLGLLVCRRIIEAHHGWMSAGRLDGRTVIRFVLPRAAPADRELEERLDEACVTLIEAP